MIARCLAGILDAILGKDLVFALWQVLEESDLIRAKDHRLIALVVVKDHEGWILMILGDVVVTTVLVERDEDFDLDVAIAGSGAIVRQVPSDSKVITVGVER